MAFSWIKTCLLRLTWVVKDLLQNWHTWWDTSFRRWYCKWCLIALGSILFWQMGHILLFYLQLTVFTISSGHPSENKRKNAPRFSWNKWYLIVSIWGQIMESKLLLPCFSIWNYLSCQACYPKWLPNLRFSKILSSFHSPIANCWLSHLSTKQDQI